MKGRLHIILLRVLFALVVTAGALMLLSAVKTKDAKPCGHVQVTYKSGKTSGFLPEKDIIGMITEIIQTQPVGAPLEKFDLRKIEMDLEKHPWVYDAQLYFDNRQTLHIMVDEAVPVARVIDVSGNHFYLDRMANELPLSPSYRADLPVFTGIPVKRNTEGALKKLRSVVGLGEVIANDSFWLAQAAQIDVLPNGKMELVPALGNHMVDLGYGLQPVEMLEKLKLYYIAAASAGKLDAYTKIIASYDKQIVGQRSMGNEPAKVQKTEAMATYQKIVEQNKKVVNANSVTTENAAGRIMTEAVNEKDKIENNNTGNQNEVKPKETLNTQNKTEKPEGKPPEKNEEPSPSKKPKAIMPKLEKN